MEILKEVLEPYESLFPRNEWAWKIRYQ
jgi:hypothetical protein